MYNDYCFVTAVINASLKIKNLSNNVICHSQYRHLQSSSTTGERGQSCIIMSGALSHTIIEHCDSCNVATNQYVQRYRQPWWRSALSKYFLITVEIQKNCILESCTEYSLQIHIWLNTVLIQIFTFKCRCE